MTTHAAPIFTVTRTFDAPRELVWRVWTQQAHLGQWMSPAGLTPLASTLDLRPGGLFHYGMKTPDGSEMWGKWVFREVTPPERLVFVQSFSDPQGCSTRHPMSADWPLEVLSTVTFTDEGSGTRLTLTGTPLNASETEQQTFEGAIGGMNQGWAGTFAQLDAYLAQAQGGSPTAAAGDAAPTITVSSVVAAPPASVWEAFTQPQHIMGWNFASPDWACPTASNDLRVGGQFSSTMSARDGSASFDFTGEYTQVQPQHLIEYRIADGRRVQVVFEALEGDQTRVTETFEAEGVHSAEQQQAGWQAILDEFRRYTEALKTA